MAETTIREAVGVFHDTAALEAAIDELSSAGFDRAEISLLADEATVAAKLGHLYDKVVLSANRRVKSIRVYGRLNVVA